MAGEMNTVERLQHLLKLQTDAETERSALVAQRDEILALADEDLRSDLNAEEDDEFRKLTHRIAVIDGLLTARDASIRTLAELVALDAPEPEASFVDNARAAAAEIFVGWRNTEPRARAPQKESGTPRRNLTIAEARTVESLDI